MASRSANGSINNTFRLELNVNETYVSGGANNYSTVSRSVVLKSTGAYTFYTIGSTVTVNVDGQVYSAYSQKDLTAGGSITIASGTKNITHNSNGEKTIYCSANYTQTATANYTPGNMNCGGNLTLTKIARYATANQSLNTRTANSIKMNWSSDSTIDYIWYSKDNGSNWTGVDVTDGTSGTYTITGLSPDTTYNIKTRVRRKDSQLTTDSSSLSVKTLGYATSVQSLNSKTVNSIKMNWSSNNTVDYIWYSKNNGSNWTGVDVTDGTSGTYTITGLSPDTTYNIKTRVRRKDSQLTTDSSSLSVKTLGYATSVQSLNSKTVNSIKMNWSSNNTVDYIWYSKDNGTSWTAVGSVNTTSGNYTISGLNPNTTYNIKTRVRRKDSQLTTDSSNSSIATYDIAKISECSDLNIGDNLVVKYTNPASASLNIGIYKTDASTAIMAYRSCSSTSYTFGFTQAELDNLYKLCGTGNSFKARVYIQTNQNSKTYTNYKEITIKLTGNVMSVKINVNGTIKRGKIWVGTSSGNKRGIMIVGTNSGNKRGI